MSARKRNENPASDDEDDKKTSSTGDTKEEDEIVVVVSKHLTDTKEDLKRIDVLLDKLDAQNVFQTDWKKDMQEIKTLVEKIDKSGIEDSSYQENLAHKSIRVETYGGRGNYVVIWRLIGPGTYDSVGTQGSLFKEDDEGNLVQTMPTEPYKQCDSDQYCPSRFNSYRIFIGKLINDIDATIDEHIKFSPGGVGYNQAEESYQNAEPPESTVVAPQTRPNVTPQAGTNAAQQALTDSFTPEPQEVSSYQNMEDSGSMGGRRKRKTKRRKRKTKRRKRKTKRRKTRGKTKRKRKRIKHRRKSKHTKR